MDSLACLIALRNMLRACGLLLAAIPLTPPLAFAGVNRWHDSDEQQEVQS